MKALLTFLYALYLLVLSVVPCGDVHAVPQHLSEVQGQAQITVSHKLHPEMGCSPFCACACCHTVVTAPPAATIVVAMVTVPLHSCWNPACPPEAHAGTAGNIWQPPKA